MDELKDLRRSLHSMPELSGRENRTAQSVAEAMPANDGLLTGLGGHGVAVRFEGSSPGPDVLLRCDMDALPIEEKLELPYRSTSSGVSHKCGHDGHMAIMAGVAMVLSRCRPASGAVTLLFQPAEETGEGARRVLDDPAFEELKPDTAFALHNLPGFPPGSVIVREGTFASASKGMIIELKGSSSHASEPHLGRSPAMAAAHLIGAFTGLPQMAVSMDQGAKATVIHVRVGEEAFGTSPGEGLVMATLRTHTPGTMKTLADRAVEIAHATAEAYGLRCAVSWTQEFPATVNDPSSVKPIVSAAEELGLQVIRKEVPFAWSEDFGHFTSACPGALFGLGAGEDHPALHSPDYDFPDRLIPAGVRLFTGIIRKILG